MFTEIIPPAEETIHTIRSLSKNIIPKLNEGVKMADVHKYMQRHRPHIIPLTRPPEFFLKAEIKPPQKAEKYNDASAITGI